MKTKFEDWINEASKDLGRAIKSEAHNSDIWHDDRGKDTKNRLLPYYLNYRMWESTNSLVLATWILAIATIFLSALTFYFQYKK